MNIGIWLKSISKKRENNNEDEDNSLNIQIEKIFKLHLRNLDI